MTHDLGVVERFADRAGLLLDGSLAMIGLPDEVTDRYRRLVG